MAKPSEDIKPPTRFKLGPLLLQILPIILLIFLSFFGAFIMHIIEEPKEIDEIKRRAALLGRILRPEDTQNTKWSFWGSFAYVLSLYTTIGYPIRVPQTVGGRVFSAIYFLIAFPLLLFCIHIIGRAVCWFALAVYGLYLRICCCWRRQQWQKIDKNRVLSLPDEKANVAYVFPLSAMVLKVICWLLIAAAILYAVDVRGTRNTTDTLLDDYGMAVWYFFIAWTTVGMELKMAVRPSGEIAAILMTVIGFVILAGFGHLLRMRLQAIKQHLIQAIDERYKRSILLGKEGVMPRDERGIENGLKVLYKQESIPNRFWLLFASRGYYQDLVDYWQRRAALTTSESQTRESSFEPRMYGIGSTKFEFRKSRDDVNSLVAMLDQTLRPFPARQIENVPEE